MHCHIFNNQITLSCVNNPIFILYSRASSISLVYRFWLVYYIAFKCVYRWFVWWFVWWFVVIAVCCRCDLSLGRSVGSTRRARWQARSIHVAPCNHTACAVIDHHCTAIGHGHWSRP